MGQAIFLLDLWAISTWIGEEEVQWTFSGLEGREHGEPGSTTTRYLGILSLQRRSVLWVFRRGSWLQGETQPGALGSFSPSLQNKLPIPSGSGIVPGRHGSVGHHSTDLPSREPISSSAGQPVSHCLSQVFIPGLDHYFYYWRWASRGKHIFGPHTKGFG